MTMKLNMLPPSVNNMSVRVFVRAAGLPYEEENVWGQTQSEEYLSKFPTGLTPSVETPELPKGGLSESCAVMMYLANREGLSDLYPTDLGRRAMVDSANSYTISMLYPLVARATYPRLGFAGYPGEVVDVGRLGRGQGSRPQGGRGRPRAPPRRLPEVLPQRGRLHRRRQRRRSPTSASRARWSSSPSRTAGFRAGRRTTCSESSRHSATRTASPQATCAATSRRSRARRSPARHARRTGGSNDRREHVDFVGVPVRDLARADDFYGKTLGLTAQPGFR